MLTFARAERIKTEAKTHDIISILYTGASQRASITTSARKGPIWGKPTSSHFLEPTDFTRRLSYRTSPSLAVARG
ncbi:hypothetical protein E5Q_01416 [Mixia osmundae IAM 14324]|uniref:Uncharacterized protein n=1 Tax=Mixia osmundae (strain CBS 9802 / IAM 14324 / JCM 22182 / KY 12970) TaxID=764103 RepID=G7DW74_MIXOS|nr:hypothetical protein E5Q_01416 [Mixia osmundae IAM 14324]